MNRYVGEATGRCRSECFAPTCALAHVGGLLDCGTVGPNYT